MKSNPATDDPRAHVVVVTRRRSDVTRLHAELERWLDGLCPVREGYNKAFVFAPGVTPRLALAATQIHLA